MRPQFGWEADKYTQAGMKAWLSILTEAKSDVGSQELGLH